MSKNKGGREIRKPKQPKQPKVANSTEFLPPHGGGGSAKSK